MPDFKKYASGVVQHLALFIVDFLVLVGIIESFQIFTPDLPLINLLVLGYMVVNAILLLSVQLGIQILEFIRIRMPTLLISYYFKLEDDETIPIPLLDPTKSRLAVLVLLLVVSGGPVLYPIFAIYGLFVVAAIFSANPLDLATLIHYFGIFLNWMPPILIIVVAVIIISIVIVEFKHV
jgi:hypothetical protein